MARDEGMVQTTYEGVHTHPIQKPTDNFESILREMHIYNPAVNHRPHYDRAIEPINGGVKPLRLKNS